MANSKQIFNIVDNIIPNPNPYKYLFHKKPYIEVLLFDLISYVKNRDYEVKYIDMCIRFSFESPCSDDEHLGKTHFRYGNVKKFITEEDLEKAACKALQKIMQESSLL
jgi:hypothetical protein